MTITIAKESVMRTIRGSGTPVLLLATGLATLFGCGDGNEEQITSVQMPLYLTGPKWPQGTNGVHTVPVCFMAASAHLPDFEVVRGKLRNAAAMWGMHANLRFTGFGLCPEVANGQVRITIYQSPMGINAVSNLGYHADSPTLMYIGSDADPGRMVHEFGHALGFNHEMVRPDFEDNDNSTIGCNAADIAGGNTVGTPANERASIMTYTYCNPHAGTLSPWDIVGVQTAYGRKAAGSVVGLDNRCLDVTSGQLIDHIIPTVRECHGGVNQKWVHNGNDSLSITLGSATKCLDIPLYQNINWTAPELSTCHDGNNQKFAFKSVAVRGLGGKCLERAGGGTANGTPIQIGECNFADTDQTWTFVGGEIRTGDGGAGSKCIDVPGGTATNGLQFTLFDCHGGTNQQFTMASGGQLRVLNKCMDVTFGTPIDGNPVGVHTCGATQLNQKWQTSGPLVTTPRPPEPMQAQEPPKCLDLPGASSFDSATPILFDCQGQGDASQRWTYNW